jgi:hypothetical protein
VEWEKKMPQVPEEIQQRLAKAGAKLILKYGVSFEDMAEYTIDISTILFEYMDVTTELEPDKDNDR